MDVQSCAPAVLRGRVEQRAAGITASHAAPPWHRFLGVRGVFFPFLCVSWGEEGKTQSRVENADTRCLKQTLTVRVAGDGAALCAYSERRHRCGSSSRSLGTCVCVWAHGEGARCVCL